LLRASVARIMVLRDSRLMRAAGRRGEWTLRCDAAGDGEGWEEEGEGGG
jgi:hypothetical protein